MALVVEAGTLATLTFGKKVELRRMLERSLSALLSSQNLPTNVAERNC